MKELLRLRSHLRQIHRIFDQESETGDLDWLAEASLGLMGNKLVSQRPSSQASFSASESDGNDFEYFSDDDKYDFENLEDKFLFSSLEENVILYSHNSQNR